MALQAEPFTNELLEQTFKVCAAIGSCMEIKPYSPIHFYLLATNIFFQHAEQRGKKELHFYCSLQKRERGKPVFFPI